MCPNPLPDKEEFKEASMSDQKRCSYIRQQNAAYNKTTSVSQARLTTYKNALK